jgi:hypothetical protein
MSHAATVEDAAGGSARHGSAQRLDVSAVLARTVGSLWLLGTNSTLTDSFTL